MKSPWFLLPAILVVGFAAFFVARFAAGPSSGQANGSGLAVSAQRVDLGILRSRNPVEDRQIYVTNKSSSPVTVASISSGCGCLRATASLPATLKQGQSVEVTLTVDTAKLNLDRHVYRISLFSPDSLEVAHFDVAYEYRPTFMADRETLVLTRAAPDSTDFVGVFQLRARVEHPDDIRLMTNHPELSVRVKGEPERGAGVISVPVEVQLQAAASVLPSTPLSLSVLKGDDPTDALFMVVALPEKEGLQARPSSLTFSESTTSADRRRTLQISGLDPGEELIVSATQPLRVIRLPFSQEERTRTIVVDLGALNLGHYSGQIELTAGNKEKLIIPVNGFIEQRRD